MNYLNNNMIQMNRDIFIAAKYLLEAGRHLGNVDKDFSIEILNISEKILSIIKVGDEKISHEELDNIFEEIMKEEN